MFATSATRDILKLIDCLPLHSIPITETSSLLWARLTSHSSLLLRIFFFEYVYFDAPVRPPRVLTHSFPLYLPHLPRAIPCSYWALFCYANLPSLAALYAISVRQARVLPIGRPFNSQYPAFFRFHLAMDTLAFG